MTIANNYVPINQLGNGTTTQFSAAWSMISAAYANVLLQDAVTGVQTPVTQGAGANQYQINITSSGFTVTFGTAPTSGQRAIIGRITAQSQGVRYTTSSGFQGAVEEASFDQLTAMVQDSSELLSRSLSAPLGDSADLGIPTAALRANSFLGFDASGNVTTYTGITGTAISTAMVPIVQSTTVLAAFDLIAAAGGVFGVIPTMPTATVGDSSLKGANTAFVQAALAVFAMSNTISGMMPSAISGTNTTGSLTISSGAASDHTHSAFFGAASFSWAVSNGNAANGYSGGTTLPNSSTIHFFIIAKSTETNWSAGFASTSLTPTLPTAYTGGKYRRVFSLLTNSSGALLNGNVVEIEGGTLLFYLATQVADVNVSNLSTTKVSYPLTVPSGIKVSPIVRALMPTNGSSVIFTSPDESDVAPSVFNTYNSVPGFDVASNDAFAQGGWGGYLTTDTASNICARASAASTSLLVVTRGWKDYRR